MKSVHRIAQELRRMGLKVNNITEPDDQVDGSIELEHNYHVQVGYNYLMLNRSIFKDDKLYAVEFLIEGASIGQIYEHMSKLN